MSDDLVLRGILFACLWELHLALFTVNNWHMCIFWRALLKLIPEAALLKHCTTDTIMKKQKSCSHAVHLMSVFTEVIWVKCPPWVPVFQPSQVITSESAIWLSKHVSFGTNRGLVELFPADRSALSFCIRSAVPVGGIPYHFTACYYTDVQTVGFVVWMQ